LYSITTDKADGLRAKEPNTKTCCPTPAQEAKRRTNILARQSLLAQIAKTTRLNKLAHNSSSPHRERPSFKKHYPRERATVLEADEKGPW